MRAFRGMLFHIIHFAVPPPGEPLLQTRVRVRKVDISDAKRGKSQFAGPSLDFQRQR